MASRNRREGRYVGAWQGKHVRDQGRVFPRGWPDADLAWSALSRRVGYLLPLRPRYIARARRWRLVGQVRAQ